MKVLVREDGTFLGTVGGGCLEAEVWEAAREVIRTENPRLLRFSLNERDYPDSGLLCGGVVQVYVESIGLPGVFVFGAGHVSKSIVSLTKAAGFRVTVVDDRPAFAKRDRFPDADDVRAGPFEEVLPLLPIRADSFCLVVTRGHHQDGTVLRLLHGRAPRYVGMIGSRAKATVLFSRLEEEGVPAEWLRTVRTPVGLPIGARTHEEIAVSIAAELVAVRRGAVLPAVTVEPLADASGRAVAGDAAKVEAHRG
jgi:xanthine dehydrogenase accessory factor